MGALGATVLVTLVIGAALATAWRAIHIEQQGREKLAAAIALSREMLELKYRLADLNASHSAQALEAMRSNVANAQESSSSQAAFADSVNGLRSKLANVDTTRLSFEDQHQYLQVQRSIVHYLDANLRAADRADAHKLSTMIAAAEPASYEQTRALVSALADRIVARSEYAAAEAARASDQATTWKLAFGIAAIGLAVLFFVSNMRALVQRSKVIDSVDVQARTDQSTGVGSRQRWNEEFPLALERARRTERSVAVAMLDLDQFDPNDTNGHLARARLLALAAKAFAGRLREGDLIARYHGEQFGLILHGCGADAAREIIDRVRDSLPKGQMLSAGVTESDGHEEANNVLGRAARAIYAAQHAGSNRTVIMRPDATVELQRDAEIPYAAVPQA